MRKAFLIAAAALAAFAVAALFLIGSHSRTADTSDYVPPEVIVSGTVKDTGTIPGPSAADGDLTYIELEIADVDACGGAEMEAAREGSSVPESGDILTLIQGDHNETYGPEPQIGDQVEAVFLYYGKDITVKGKQRTAYELYHIETRDWLLETGQNSLFPDAS